jgi:WD40 repeat protein
MLHRVRRLSVLLVSAFALLAFATTASAREVLYGAGAAGDGGSPSTLYILDPATGSPLQTIGPIGFSVTGLAMDPADGTLYGSTGRTTSGGATNPGSLIRVDRTSGAGSLIGDLRPDTDTAGDLTFTPDGALYGWLVPSDDLATIDKASGAATPVGESGIVGNTGSGLASSPAGTLFHAALDSDSLYTVDRTTGAATAVAPLNGTESLEINALTFSATGALFGSWLDYGSTGPRPSRLLTIDTGSGAITFLGPSVNRLDAVAFVEVQSERTVTFKAAKVKQKRARELLAIGAGGKARLSGEVSAPKDVAGCESNQPVQLQRKKPKGKTFKTFKQVRTNASGDFSSKQKVKKTFVYRALLAETAGCDDATSAGKRVKAKKR